MFKVGADPELFLKIGDEFVSADTERGPVIPGTKDNPHKVKGGAIQVDGTAVEFNVDPETDSVKFYENTKSVLMELKKEVKKVDERLRLTPEPVAEFNPKYFSSLPEKAKELGCDPDFSAYTLSQNPTPLGDRTFRTGAGHVHLSWGRDMPINESLMWDCGVLVKALDQTLGYAALDWDKDTKRKELYGAPGAFRPKHYGVEYRTPSNVWVRSPKTIMDVFRISLGTLRMVDSGRFDVKKKPLFTPLKTKSRTEQVLNYLGGYVYDI